MTGEEWENFPRTVMNIFKAAKFPVLKTIDTFDFHGQPSINEALVRELIRGDYIEKRENLLLLGNPGTGKSHLACALGYAACIQGYKVRFHTVMALVTHLLEKREERSLERFQNQLARHHLLVLDELGYVPFSKAGAELLFDVVSQAYEQTSLIVTTNLPFEEWSEIFGNPLLASAALDHLTHHAHVIEIKGSSYRQKQRKAKQPPKSPKPEGKK